MSKQHVNVELRLTKACEDVSDLPLSMGSSFPDLVADWLPLIREALKQFGLKMATESLPVLRKTIEEWQPKGFLMKMLRKQLISAIAQLEEAIEKDSSLGDLAFFES
jgi:hypothetical protein